MRKVSVGIPGKKYYIHIGENLLSGLGGLLRPHAKEGAQTVLVTDENVWRFHGEKAAASLSAAGIDAHTVILPPGERNKSLSGLSGLYDAFAANSLRRDGLILALGGGVIGDLCGYAAASWLRGVRYIQIPTTLLAQVDSSVGGKTAVNLPQGKNLVGAFYQPELVIIDTQTLETLPKREIRCGMAEVLKYGAIRSARMLEALGREGASPDIIEQCCVIKAGIVERDERDTGERMLLNFGHTFGHAIEKKYDYERYNHGEAVAIGMAIAAVIGEIAGVTQAGTAGFLQKVMEPIGLDTRLPCPVTELLPYIENDKKSGGDGVSMVLLRTIGDALTHKMSFAEIGAAARKADEQWAI